MEEQFRPKERVGGSSPSRGAFCDTAGDGVGYLGSDRQNRRVLACGVLIQ